MSKNQNDIKMGRTHFIIADAKYDEIGRSTSFYQFLNATYSQWAENAKMSCFYDNSLIEHFSSERYGDLFSLHSASNRSLGLKTNFMSNFEKVIYAILDSKKSYIMVTPSYTVFLSKIIAWLIDNGCIDEKECVIIDLRLVKSDIGLKSTVPVAKQTVRSDDESFFYVELPMTICEFMYEEYDELDNGESLWEYETGGRTFYYKRADHIPNMEYYKI